MSGGHPSEEEEDSQADSDDFLRAVARAPEVEPAPLSRPSGSLVADTRIAQFRIFEQIGRGGMGIVYRARDEKLERVVALKVLPSTFEDDAGRRRRFMREARVAASIAHANVATVYEVGEADGRIYIAMELVQGVTLRQRLASEPAGGPLSVAEALRIAKDVARGVAKAHARGIAHRDLKPDNVMVADDGTVKVLDFGLAKPTEVAGDSHDAETASLTQEGRIVGTPGYMSPEQATGKSLDLRTDVFSLGVVVYEMVTGVRPFRGDTPMDTVIATSRDEPTPPSALNPRVPTSLEALLSRCLKKSPADRYATADEVLAALEGIDLSAPAQAPTATATEAAAAAAAVAPATRRSRRALAVLAAPAVAILAVAAWPRRAPSPSAATPAPPAVTLEARTTATVAPPASAPAAASQATIAVAPLPPPVVPRVVRPSGPRSARTNASAAPSASSSAAPAPAPATDTTVTTPGGVIRRSPY